MLKLLICQIRTLSESARLGRADAIASVFVDNLLEIYSSRTNNP